MDVLIAIAELVGAISVIIGAFFAVEKWTKGKLSAWLLKPVFTRLDAIENRITKVDINQCKNFLNEFLADIKNGVPKTEYQKARAHEVYAHYKDDLHQNSYIKKQWEELMKP